MNNPMAWLSYSHQSLSLIKNSCRLFGWSHKLEADLFGGEWRITASHDILGTYVIAHGEFPLPTGLMEICGK